MNRLTTHEMILLLAICGFGLIITALLYRLTDTLYHRTLWIGTFMLIIGYTFLFTFSLLTFLNEYKNKGVHSNKDSDKKTRKIYLRTVGHSVLFALFALALVFHITHSYAFYDFFAVIGHGLIVVATYVKIAWLMKIAVVFLAIHYAFGTSRKIYPENAYDIIQLAARSMITLYYTLSITTYANTIV